MDNSLLSKIIQEAQDLIEQEEYNKVIDLYIDINRKLPNTIRIIEALARAYYLNSQYAESQKFLLECVEAKHTNFEIKHFLANSYYFTKEYSKAEIIYKELLPIQPDNQYLLYFYGTTLRALGNVNDAIKLFEHSLELNYEDENAHLVLADIFQESEPKRAIKHYEKAIELEPDDDFRGTSSKA